MTKLVKFIHSHFEGEGWEWNIGGELVPPTEDDISKTLDRMQQMLYPEPDGTQIELGRLIMRKDAEGYEVYIYLGDYATNGDSNA